MLFVLTGEVQVGKTRWLEGVLDELAALGVVAEGVLAPGVWRETVPADPGGPSRPGAPEPRFEKLGIDNRLLPDGPVISFARRRDLAREAGAGGLRSQSARMGLGWEISEAALSQVNAHFDELAELSARSESPGAPAASAAARLLVVDELGRLELERAGGLSSALSLLAAGPTPRHPHAVAVVRACLLPAAREHLEPTWGNIVPIGPDDAGRAALMRAWGVE